MTWKFLFCIWRHCLGHITLQRPVTHLHFLKVTSIGDYIKCLILRFTEFYFFLLKLYMYELKNVIFGPRLCVPYEKMFIPPVKIFLLTYVIDTKLDKLIFFWYISDNTNPQLRSQLTCLNQNIHRLCLCLGLCKEKGVVILLC